MGAAHRLLGALARNTQLVLQLEAGTCEGLRQSLRDHPAVAAQLPALEARVAAGEETPERAARQFLAAFRS